jgi:hypothetical protein
MRQRSGAFHCDDLADLLEASQQSPKAKAKKQSLDHIFDGFDFTTPSKLSAAETECDMELPTKQVLFKILVLGIHGCRKHHLINQLFKDTQAPHENKRPSHDLITFTKEEEEVNLKFHFWVFDTSDNTYSQIDRVYHRILHTIVLVINLGDLASFQNVEQLLVEIQEGAPLKKVILISTNPKNVQPPVITPEHISKLITEYGIDHYFHADSGCESEDMQKLSALLTQLAILHGKKPPNSKLAF